MKLTLLGTGDAIVTDCYNTCFVLSEGDEAFLTDGGGGIALLHQLKAANIDWHSIKNIFVTHKHIDHLLGIIWIMRVICDAMNHNKYDGTVNLYAHEEVVGLLRDMAQKLFKSKDFGFVDNGMNLITVADGETREIMGREVTFFDIHSTKAKQFGYVMQNVGGGKLTCCGDEPFCEQNRALIEGSRWLLHESFCLYAEREKYNPYEKNHCTVKEAAENAQSLGVENLVIYHTEQDNLKNRPALYTAEARQYFGGNIFVPYDLDVIELD